jgi:uncharacterized protein
MRSLRSLLLLVCVVPLVACATLSRMEAANGATPGSASVLAVSAQMESHKVTVTGEAELRVVPDQVILTVGVQTQQLDLGAAKDENDRIVRAALAVARDYGVPAELVQTEYIHIEPRYRDSYEKRDFLGYAVWKSMAITLRDVGKFEGLLSALLDAGVTNVLGVDFQTTELRKNRDQARTLALKAAQEKAAAMAGALGHKVGEPLSIREDQSNWVSGYSWWGSRGTSMTQNVIQNVGEASLSSDSTLAPGQIAVSARVTVEFSLQ